AAEARRGVTQEAGISFVGLPWLNDLGFGALRRGRRAAEARRGVTQEAGISFVGLPWLNDLGFGALRRG
ncbi:hypothetical protein CTI14_72290, partial [Methylobacterium radiotolerans]